jgi:hypothetical protein
MPGQPGRYISITKYLSQNIYHKIFIIRLQKNLLSYNSYAIKEKNKAVIKLQKKTKEKYYVRTYSDGWTTNG